MCDNIELLRPNSFAHKYCEKYSCTRILYKIVQIKNTSQLLLLLFTSLLLQSSTSLFVEFKKCLFVMPNRLSSVQTFVGVYFFFFFQLIKEISHYVYCIWCTYVQPFAKCFSHNHRYTPKQIICKGKYITNLKENKLKTNK